MHPSAPQCVYRLIRVAQNTSICKRYKPKKNHLYSFKIEKGRYDSKRIFFFGFFLVIPLIERKIKQEKRNKKNKKKKGKLKTKKSKFVDSFSLWNMELFFFKP